MKSFDYIALHEKGWLRAVECEDGTIAGLSNRMSLPHHQLKEILLIPQDAPTITEKFLAQTRHHTIRDLLAIYLGQKVAYRDHVYLVKNKIIGHFFLSLPYPVADWNFSVREEGEGHVISVVVGNRAAMNKMYEQEKKLQRPRALVAQV